MATLYITSEPLQELQPVYRPLVYDFQILGAITPVGAAMSVQVQINGANFGDPIPVTPWQIVQSATFYVHYFEVNVAERVQSFFDMADFLPDVATSTATTGANLQAEVNVVASYYYPDADGVLQLDSTTLTSQTFVAINAWRRADEQASLEYYDAFETPAVPQRARFLTRKPGRTILTDEDSEFLGLYGKGFSTMRIRTYDTGGALLAEGQILAGISAFGADELTILPVGPANINAIDPSAWVNGTGPVTIDSSVHYYIIQAGLGFSDGNFWVLSDLRRYYVVPNYCKRHRIHFINSFGMPDSFTIWNNERFEIDVEGETFERSLPDLPGIVDPGTMDVQRSGRLSVNSPVGNLTREDQEFLAREFAMSPRVWIQQNNDYIPVTIEGGNFDILNTSETSQELTFSLTYSRRELSQRN